MVEKDKTTIPTMNIFLPFTIKGIGGTATFAAKFKEGMEKHGHSVFFEEPADYDILFLIVQAPFRHLWRAKRAGKKIVQRLDGTYYWAVASWRFPLYNLKAALIRHFFADFTIYQSEYSKYCAKRFLGKKKNGPSALIYNGVDLELFSPNGSKTTVRDNPQQQIFFTASAFRREDQIIPVLRALQHYREKYTDNFKFLVAGTFSSTLNHLPEQWAAFKNVVFLGKIENEDLPPLERAADVFLFTHLNPPCPNNVIEAMGCGLPICGIADGAMRELVHQGENGLLLPVIGNAFWQQRSYDDEAFADQLHALMQYTVPFGKKSRILAEEKLSLDHMIQNYITALSQSLTEK